MAFRMFSVCLFAVLFSSGYAAPTDEQKPFDCPPNEYYEKCSLIVCQKVCHDLFIPVGCPSVSSDCFQPACVCNSGYIRNDKGVCVPYAQCEEKCEENEEFSKCYFSVCRIQECYERGQENSCKPFDLSHCQKGCVCKEKYLRRNGTCVPEHECGDTVPYSNGGIVIQ